MQQASTERGPGGTARSASVCYNTYIDVHSTTGSQFSSRLIIWGFQISEKENTDVAVRGLLVI